MKSYRLRIKGQMLDGTPVKVFFEVAALNKHAARNTLAIIMRGDLKSPYEVTLTNPDR